MIDQNEFNARLQELGTELRSVKLLLAQVPGGFDGWPERLKQQAYQRLGVRPVTMYVEIKEREL